MLETSEKRRVYTVSRLNQDVQSALEDSFGLIWLQGELSNLSRPSSGHIYFSLKDSRAQIRCAMFKGRNRYIDFDPSSGDEVLVRGKLGLYAARGDYQLIVEHMEPAGTGKLQQTFEATKRKLDALGWFNVEEKKRLPAMPHSIGVVTSATGAAIQDVLHVLARRCPQANIIIYPTLVQGANAAPNIVKAITTAARRAEVDIILLVRGGGSLEDLWAFNEESVAAAIRDCPTPLISGVGHEVDITIADFVADLRAPTPSAAAEMATPDVIALNQRAHTANQSLARIMSKAVNQRRLNLQSLQNRLNSRHPQRLIQDRVQRTDELEARLINAMQRRLETKAFAAQQLQGRLSSQSPSVQLKTLHAKLANTEQRLNNRLHTLLNDARNRWQLAARGLDTVSPLATIDRGFAVVKHNKHLVRDVSELTLGDTLQIQVAKGYITSTVTKLEKKK